MRTKLFNQLPVTFLIGCILLLVACAPAEQSLEDEVPTSTPVTEPTEPALATIAPTDAPVEPTEEPAVEDTSLETEAAAETEGATETDATPTEEPDSYPAPPAESYPAPEPDAYPVDESASTVDPYPVGEQPSTDSSTAYPYPAQGNGAAESSVVEPYPIEGGNGSLVEQPSIPMVVIESGPWYLATIIENGVATSLVEGTEISAEFLQGNVSGSAGCNTFNSTYTENGRQFSFGEIALTRRGCEEAIGQQETRFVDALRAVNSWQISPNMLLLVHPTGALQFSKQAGGAGDTSIPAPNNDLDIQTAMVDEFQIVVDNASKTATITLIGNYPDGCAKLNSIMQNREDETTLSFTMLFERPLDMMCTQTLVPFNETFPLDISGLEAGTYQVVVNNLTGEFTLD